MWLVREPSCMSKLLDQCVGKEHNWKAVQEFIEAVKLYRGNDSKRRVLSHE
jgi:hypothetical protein